MKKKITVQAEVTTKDIKVVQSLADGNNVREIAEATGTNLKTLEAHVARMKNFYGVENIPHLVAFFLRNKLIK